MCSWVLGSHRINIPLNINMKVSCCSEQTLALPWQESRFGGGVEPEEMGSWMGIGTYGEWHLMCQTL